MRGKGDSSVLTRFLSSFLRPLAWCFLASVIIASLEALGSFALLDSGSIPLLPEFLLQFTTTCAVLLAVITVTWFFLWFFLVWLGGARTGIVLFFTLYFFIVAGYLVLILDLVFAYTNEYAAYWGLLMRYFVGFAFVSAVLITLVLGKITRNRQPSVSPRAFSIFAALLAGMAFALWFRETRFSQVSGNLYLGIFVAAAAVAAAALWALAATPRRLNAMLFIFAVLVFLPLPIRYFTRPPVSNPAPVPASSQRDVRHVVLITVDTLRRDALGCYNPDKAGHTPRLDGLAGESAMFTEAYSTAPWTCPSVTSILTGLAPQVHQFVDGKGALTEKAPTLAEAMRDAGYHTAAFGFNGLLLPRSKLDRGFLEYHWFPMQKFQVKNFDAGLTHYIVSRCGRQLPDAAGLTDRAIHWIQHNHDRDFFLWIHYFDPHIPYMPPEKYQPEDAAFREKGTQFKETRGGRMGSAARSAEDRAWIKALYDGEVRYIDAEVGRLLDSLRKQNIYDQALVAFTSDHGEEFWDHDRFEHGHTLYNELVHVPLFIKQPGNAPGMRVDARVSTQAIMPTLLDLCDAAPKTPEILLPPLSPLLAGAPGAYEEKPVYIGASLFHDHLEGILFGPMKYVHASLSGHELLFNLVDDPKELNSLVFQDPANLETGRQLLEEARSADTRLREQLDIPKDAKDVLNHEDIRSLEALGYL